MDVETLTKKIISKVPAREERKNLKIKLGNLEHRKKVIEDEIKELEKQYEEASAKFELGLVPRSKFEGLKKKIDELKDEKVRVNLASIAVRKMIDETSLKIVEQAYNAVREEWEPFFKEGVALAKRLAELTKLQDKLELAYQNALIIPAPKDGEYTLSKDKSYDCPPKRENINISYYWSKIMETGARDEQGNFIYWRAPTTIPEFRVKDPFVDLNLYTYVSVYKKADEI